MSKIDELTADITEGILSDLDLTAVSEAAKRAVAARVRQALMVHDFIGRDALYGRKDFRATHAIHWMTHSGERMEIPVAISPAVTPGLWNLWTEAECHHGATIAKWTVDRSGIVFCDGEEPGGSVYLQPVVTPEILAHAERLVDEHMRFESPPTPSPDSVSEWRPPYSAMIAIVASAMAGAAPPAEEMEIVDGSPQISIPGARVAASISTALVAVAIADGITREGFIERMTMVYDRFMAVGDPVANAKELCDAATLEIVPELLKELVASGRLAAVLPKMTSKKPH